MKINEIIVESRSQLDEGMMDTIKSKLSGVYQMARKKYPNFDEVFTVAKSHKAEINDIIDQLKAKKKTGKLGKEDVIAAITPLSKKIAGEVGGKGVVNENMTFRGAMIGSMLSPIVWLIINLIGDVGFYSVLFTSIAIFSSIGISFDLEDSAKNNAIEKSRSEWREKYETPRDKEFQKKLDASVKQSADEKKKEGERNRSGLLDKALDGALLGAEYRSLERQYKENRHKMSYAQTRRMEELYNRGFR